MSPSPWQCCVLLYRPEDMNHIPWLLLICLIECVTEGWGTGDTGDGDSPSKCLPQDKTQSWEFYDCLWLLTTIRSVAPHKLNRKQARAASKGNVKMFCAVPTLSFTTDFFPLCINMKSSCSVAQSSWSVLDNTISRASVGYFLLCQKWEVGQN